MFKHILVPVDGSATSMQAAQLDVAVERAGWRGGGGEAVVAQVVIAGFDTQAHVVASGPRCASRAAHGRPMHRIRPSGRRR